MLLLTRDLREEVIVTLPDGRRGRVVLCELRPGKARLGFDFPNDVGVHRSETQAKIDAVTDAQNEVTT